MERYKALTEEEVAEVRKYAEQNGRSWKRKLGFAWMNASEPGILQALRNSHGPGWLQSYRLPKLEGR